MDEIDADGIAAEVIDGQAGQTEQTRQEDAGRHCRRRRV